MEEKITGEVVEEEYPMTSPSGKKYRLLKVDEDGKEWREYENGFIRDQRGTVLVLPDVIRENHLITSEGHEKWENARKQKYLEAVESGVTKGADAYGVLEAVSKIMAKRTKVALSDDGRSGNDATKIVMQALDAFQDKQVKHQHIERQEYSIEPETMEVLEKLLEMKREA